MTDLLTPQPDTVLQLLRGAGAQCGTPAAPDGMKTCLAARHCVLNGSEVCVRALGDAGAPPAAMNTGLAVGSGLGLVLIGVAIGWVLRRP